MAGVRNPAACHAVRVESTECLVLELPLPERLVRHLAGCPECAGSAEDTEQVLRTFRRAEYVPPGIVEPPAPSAELGDLVLRRVCTARRARRRAVLAVAVCGTVVALGTAGLLAREGSGRPAPAAAPRVSLAPAGPMLAEPWGTEVPVSLTGLLPHHVYRLVTRDAAGHRAPAGSVRLDGPRPRGVRVDLVTAMGRDAIAALLIDDDHGRPVAEADLAPLGEPSGTP